MTPHTLTDYLNQRYNKLREFEGEPTQTAAGSNQGHVYAYADPIGIPTIGIGINIRSDAHFNLVLQVLGFDIGRTALGGEGTAADAAEQGYINRIRDVIDTGIFTKDASSTNAVRQALNAILAERAIDPAYNAYPGFPRVTDFAFASTDVSRNVFNTVMAGYPNPVTGEHVEGYEEVVDRWLRTRVGITEESANSFLLNRDNQERLALVSMGYSSRRDANNIPTLFGRKLTRALSYNDRAEVWYEIRYGSNAGAIHATRRYKESDLFSLYNDKDSIISLARSDANDADAKSAYRVYTRHRDTPITVTEVVNGTPQQVTYNGIVAYEARFSTAYGGQTAETNAIRTQLTPAHDYLVQSDYKRQPAHPRRARPGPRRHGVGIRRQEGSVVRRRRRDPGRGGHLKRLAQDRQLRLERA